MVEDFSRHIAVKSSILPLLMGKYVKGEDGQADYVLINTNEKIFRLNLIAIVVSSSKTGSITNFLVDDGSERIVLKFFEEEDRINQIELGDTILCVGKLRTYNNERYIAPEICKKIDPLWLKVRILKLSQKKIVEIPVIETKKEEKKFNVEEINMENIKGEVAFTSADKIEESEELISELENISQEDKKPLTQLVLEMIKDEDSGEGVFIDNLIEKLDNKDVEKIVEKMLETGDIFQNLPGRVKIL